MKQSNLGSLTFDAEVWAFFLIPPGNLHFLQVLHPIDWRLWMDVLSTSTNLLNSQNILINLITVPGKRTRLPAICLRLHCTSCSPKWIEMMMMMMLIIITDVAAKTSVPDISRLHVLLSTQPQSALNMFDH